MKKAALVFLAVCMIFPLLATWAEPPKEAKADPAVLVTTSQLISLPVADSPLEAQNLAPEAHEVQLPEGFELPAPDAKGQYKRGYFALRLPSETPRQRLMACMAANGGNASLCDVAADIANMKPCLAANADDCPAMEAWTQAMGRVGIYPAPQIPVRASNNSNIRVDRSGKEKD